MKKRRDQVTTSEQNNNSSKDKMASFVEKSVAKVDDFIASNPKLDEILGKVEEKTKVKKSYLLLSSVAILTLWLASGHAGQLLCNAIGFLYPAYASIKAIGNQLSKSRSQFPFNHLF